MNDTIFTYKMRLLLSSSRVDRPFSKFNPYEGRAFFRPNFTTATDLARFRTKGQTELPPKLDEIELVDALGYIIVDLEIPFGVLSL